MRVGTTIRVMKCQQHPKIVGQVAKIVAVTTPTKCVVEFFDGYKREIRKSWLKVVE